MQKLLRMDGYAAPPLVGAEAARWRTLAAGLARRAGAAITAWAIRRGTRRALAELERHHLLDIGKTAEEARREAAKPFWRS
jgi:uncharacterized protein YjiS (DUF1127 family)